jgi:hypothetical protein
MLKTFMYLCSRFIYEAMPTTCSNIKTSTNFLAPVEIYRTAKFTGFTKFCAEIFAGAGGISSFTVFTNNSTFSVKIYRIAEFANYNTFVAEIFLIKPHTHTHTHRTISELSYSLHNIYCSLLTAHVRTKLQQLFFT